MRTMRSLRPAIGLLAVLAIAALAAPASATHGGIHPTVREERTYFHCTGPTKVENLNLILGGPTTWNAEPPAGSYQEGEGCGSLDPGALRGGNPGTIYDAVFAGTFTGNIRDLTIELHNLALSRARTGTTFEVRVRMLIDGLQIFPETAGVQVEVTPELSSTGASEKFLISVPNLGCSREILDEQGNVVDVVTDGFVSENGDGTSEHTIQLAIDSIFVNRAGAWVWDATEIPSGITFNPTGQLATAQANPLGAASCV